MDVNGHKESTWTLLGALASAAWLLFQPKYTGERQFVKKDGFTFFPFKSITDERGTLTVMEHPPFPIRRVYFLHNIKAGEKRGGHAHRVCRRIYVPIFGTMRATIDGKQTLLQKPTKGLVVEPMQWAELDEFSPGAVCLVLASEGYVESECIRDRAEFERLKK